MTGSILNLLVPERYHLNMDLSTSSSGSAVGTAMDLAAAAPGTETDGSVISPAEVASPMLKPQGPWPRNASPGATWERGGRNVLAWGRIWAVMARRR
ncbi:hypothetical protein GGTG_04528 [Gaeumannomyces tritici R3-111a-1]|uniref:Uncharacterized protein n=1 Tax=Gaeumannomyces tritici (strain R3-111a-1) TaxID=644352 RepID=J3NTC9_GAET3|nr:hypothetical protein GGTG_04528 [Gaeumannomyces tritici R3-111a-1]EJT79444.1 hypothetical protein GGTG_04528 [Gaeumannomyces tritici R3-111a-1]